MAELAIEQDSTSGAWWVFVPGGDTIARLFGSDAEKHARLFQRALAGRLWDEAIEAAAAAVDETAKNYPADVFPPDDQTPDRQAAYGARVGIANAALAVRQLKNRRP